MSVKEVLFFEQEMPSLMPTIVGEFFGYPIASSTLSIFAILVLFAFVGYRFYKNASVVPSSWQVVIEFIYEWILDLVEQITNDKKRTQQVFSIVLSIFLYLVVANVFTLLPFIGQITVDGVAIFQTPSADFNTTLGLALGVVIVLQVLSIKEWGLLAHIGKYIPLRHVVKEFRKGVGAGFSSLVDVFVGVLDIIGEFAKVLSLSLRLFGNMFAGNVLLIVLMGIFAYVLPAVWVGMNLFVGILQAMVFSALAASYYMLAIKPEDESKIKKEPIEDVQAV